MQFKTHITFDELKADSDPLFYLCHPLGKLSLMSDMIGRFVVDCPKEPLINVREPSLNAIHEIIRSAIEEIQIIQEAANERLEDLERSRDELAEKLKAIMPAVELAEKLKVHPSSFTNFKCGESAGQEKEQSVNQ